MVVEILLDDEPEHPLLMAETVTGVLDGMAEEV
jgi:hypothetical protein